MLQIHAINDEISNTPRFSEARRPHTLILTHREDETLIITFDPSTPPDLTARELFAAGPVVVHVR